MRRRYRNADGFVAIEWVAAVALLLLPIVVLVATLPVWAERRNTATVAAREAVRQLVNDWPNASVDAATETAREVAADHGVDPSELRLQVASAGAARASEVRVQVDVTMPAIAVGNMHAGEWHYTAVAVRRIDDYRSR